MASVWGLTDRGTVREQNEDACAFAVENTFLWGVVCDGMGGAAAGEVASSVAAETFTGRIAQYGQTDLELPPEKLLPQIAEEANHAIYQRAKEEPSCYGMGTTMVGAVLRDGLAWVVNVGDSRAYYITEAGIRQVSRDHSLVQEMVDAGYITREEARFHPRRNLITRVLGTTETEQADVFRQLIQPGEYLLLCSDGLVDALTDEAIRDEILSGGTVEEICRRLMGRALEKGASDNVTIVLFQG